MQKGKNFHHIIKDAIKLNVPNYRSVADRCLRRVVLLWKMKFQAEESYGAKEKRLAARYCDAPARTFELCFIRPQLDFFCTWKVPFELRSPHPWSQLGTNVNTPFFQVPTLVIRARCRYPIRVKREWSFSLVRMSRPCTWAQKWAPSPCVHTIFVRSGQSTALFSVLSSCFKMASDRAKWNDVRSHISGTQSVTTTPFCAGSQSFDPENQVWTAP